MISTQRMKELEQMSEQNGISKLQLMENAAKATIRLLGTPNLYSKKICIFCYQGNNSGDGFAMAKQLASQSDLTVLFMGDEEHLSKEARFNLDKIKENGRVRIIKYINELEKDYDIIIDAMLGTGGKGMLREPVRSAVMKYNSMEISKLSLDVPTGMDPDTGAVEDICCLSDLIITFHKPKTGLKDVMEKVKIVDIGIKDDDRETQTNF